ncbi:hypothetical protein D3C72_2272790 [compost metagenome]
MGEIIWSKLNLLASGQDIIKQCLVAKQQIPTLNTVKNYFKVLEVISFLNYDRVFNSRAGTIV